VIYIQSDGGHVGFCQKGDPIPVPGKNVKHMALSPNTFPKIKQYLGGQLEILLSV